MPIAFYMDHHVPRAITLGLRVRKVEVLTAYEDGTAYSDEVDHRFRRCFPPSGAKRRWYFGIVSQLDNISQQAI